MIGRLTADELPGDAPGLARFLIGKLIVHRRPDPGTIVARIVETEAYLADDPASHSFRGRTRRNASMFLPAGHAYCYLSYGCWTALNVASGADGVGEAVLIRAAEIIAGDESVPPIPRLPRAKVASGPGRLTRALGVTLGHDSIDLCADPGLFLAADGTAAGQIVSGPRIGITKAVDVPLRFFERGNFAVSGPKRLHAAASPIGTVNIAPLGE